MISTARHGFSMKLHKNLIRLRHMLDACREASEFIRDLSYKEFEQNRLVGNAVVRSLEVAGEAAARLTSEFKDKHDTIEWHVIVGMRNRLIHAYFDINYRSITTEVSGKHLIRVCLF